MERYTAALSSLQRRTQRLAIGLVAVAVAYVDVGLEVASTLFRAWCRREEEGKVGGWVLQLRGEHRTAKSDTVAGGETEDAVGSGRLRLQHRQGSARHRSRPGTTSRQAEASTSRQ
nr:hypothetical protein CFP56_70778 [Quercus suber]